MDLDALTDLGKGVAGFRLTHLPSLHAKIYVADRKMAIVTSGNLTEGGLRGNLEYGVALRDDNLAGQIRSDIEAYASLGATVPVEDVAALAS
jgi:phosphatidylserine/phosphatidylglycerophosphate/cardiolipin synthase-like enzyme